MIWLKSFLAGVLNSIAVMFGAGLVAALCVEWYHISSFEGGSGYFVVFLALLELIRLKQITAAQHEPFADITLERTPSLPNPAEVIPVAARS